MERKFICIKTVTLGKQNPKTYYEGQLFDLNDLTTTISNHSIIKFFKETSVTEQVSETKLKLIKNIIKDNKDL